MKIYLVGGAVRDHLLGQPIKERDWVVVGATVEDMLKSGYRQVGKEFPVFLHPKTREEYALARMERKVRPGYKGFTFDTSPDVTLEEDLIRRDLTINAMAETESGELIDPYHGKQDLEKKLLKHVSPAFAEDPVRILRVGRFLARYYHLGFSVADATIALMSQMVNAGEVDALVAERVWKELERALGEKNPEQFFHALSQCGALHKLFPELNEAGLKALIAATKITPYPDVRFAALLYPCNRQDINHLCHRYRLPHDYAELAKLTAEHHETALRAESLDADMLCQLFRQLDIYRRKERFLLFITACKAIAAANNKAFSDKKLLEGAEVARGFNVQDLIAQGYKDKELAEKIQEGRKAALERHMF